jgi:hypothetical protein
LIATRRVVFGTIAVAGEAGTLGPDELGVSVCARSLVEVAKAVKRIILTSRRIDAKLYRVAGL